MITKIDRKIKYDKSNPEFPYYHKDIFDGSVIKRIDPKLAHDFILNKHYAQRLPNIKYAFGYFNCDNELMGILTIGKPASNSLCKGVCGEEYSKYVYELNRLCLDGNYIQNVLSHFVGKCLRLLKKENIILVSYSDKSMNHNGYIYQATNFIYTGSTKERTDKYVPDGKHSRHYTEEFNHLRTFRSSKNRYIYFIGKMKKEFLNNLKYEILPYPKNENKRYILGEKIKTKILNKNTNEVYEI